MVRELVRADHVLESISGHLSRRMLEHYSHIRIDAKRLALDALDAARRATTSNGNGAGQNGYEIEAVVEVSDELTSQSAVERVARRLMSRRQFTIARHPVSRRRRVVPDW
jgi:hypothetical protein